MPVFLSNWHKSVWSTHTGGDDIGDVGKSTDGEDTTHLGFFSNRKAMYDVFKTEGRWSNDVSRIFYPQCILMFNWFMMVM